MDLGGLSPSLPDVPLARAFDAAQVLVLQRVLNPLFKLQRALDIGAERRLREAIRDLDLFAEDVISKRREEISAAHVAGKPFVRCLSLKIISSSLRSSLDEYRMWLVTDCSRRMSL